MRAPLSAGPKANDGKAIAPAMTSVREAPETRNATSPLPPGER